MIFILLSISCSVTVAVLLKLAKRYHINVLQAVLWNYLAAILLGLLVFKPEVSLVLVIPSGLQLSLGILLPVLFLVLSAAIRNIGIVKTDIAQRLSLFIPVIASVILFGEELTGLKITGLVIGFSAILLTLSKKSVADQKIPRTLEYLFPLAVFIGFGIIDVLFKTLAIDKTVPYTSALLIVFGVSFIVATLILIYTIVVKHQVPEFINFACGIILGCFNFGNILFYMKAHRQLSDHPSTVFAAMNMGVVLTGSLVGIFFFKERVNKFNYIGILLALVAILLITLSQAHAI